MGLFICILTIVVLEATLTKGNGCANLPSNQPNGQVINTCEANVIMVSGFFYLSGSSAEMGNMTRCNCSIVALTQEARLSAIGSAVPVPQFTQCNATWHIRGSREETFTCQNIDNFFLDMNSSIVTVDIKRHVLDDFDFCLYVSRRDAMSGDSYNVTCENNADQSSSTTTSASSTTASAASGASTVTSTDAPPVTSQEYTSLGSSASLSTSHSTGSPRPSSTAVSSVPPPSSSMSGSTVPPPSSTASGSMIPPVFTSTTGYADGVEACPCQCSVCVAMAVVGWTVAAVLGAALIVVCIRLRRATSARSPEGGADNAAYAHLSELTRTDLRTDPNYSVVGHSVTRH